MCGIAVGIGDAWLHNGPIVLSARIGFDNKPPITGLHNKHWPAGPPAFFSRRASDTQLLLARTGHKVFVRTIHCHIMLARTIIQRADLFPHCRDHFVRNATRLTHRIEFPCYVGDIQPLTVYPTIPLVLI